MATEQANKESLLGKQFENETSLIGTRARAQKDVNRDAASTAIENIPKEADAKWRATKDAAYATADEQANLWIKANQDKGYTPDQLKKGAEMTKLESLEKAFGMKTEIPADLRAKIVDMAFKAVDNLKEKDYESYDLIKTHFQGDAAQADNYLINTYMSKALEMMKPSSLVNINPIDFKGVTDSLMTSDDPLGDLAKIKDQYTPKNFAALESFIKAAVEKQAKEKPKAKSGGLLGGIPMPEGQPIFGGFPTNRQEVLNNFNSGVAANIEKLGSFTEGLSNFIQRDPKMVEFLKTIK